MEIQTSNATGNGIKRSFDFSEVPDGFTLVNDVRNEDVYSKTYQNDNGDSIVLDQMASENSLLHLDNENGEVWEQRVGNRGVKFYRSDGLMIACWQESGCLLMVSYYGQIEFDSMVKLVESVE